MEYFILSHWWIKQNIEVGYDIFTLYHGHQTGPKILCYSYFLPSVIFLLPIFFFFGK